MSEPAFLGRITSIALTDDDNVLIQDAIGNALKLLPNSARSLHRELGKFLAASNDAKPLPAPTRADFRALEKRVSALEATDGCVHSWVFDGDDPYVNCSKCGRMQDALTGHVIKHGATS